MRRILCYAIFIFPLMLSQSYAEQEVKDPIKEAARKLEKQIREDNYRDLKLAANELLALSKDLNDEVEKSGEFVMSARIFEKLEKIDKVTKRIRDKARGPY